jgi:hypothetical protein
LLFASAVSAADIHIGRPSQLGCAKISGITTTGDSYWVDARGRPLVVAFEPDMGGALTTLTVAVQHCFTENDTDTCVDYPWLDNAGVSDNVLDGTSGARRGFQWSISAGWLRFTIGGVATGTGELRICQS